MTDKPNAVEEIIRKAAADANPEAPFWTFSSRDTAKAVLAALSSAGLKVVPEQPTDAMCEAGDDGYYGMTDKPNAVEELLVKGACGSIRPDLKCKMPTCDCWQLKVQVAQAQIAALSSAGLKVVPEKGTIQMVDDANIPVKFGVMREAFAEIYTKLVADFDPTTWTPGDRQ